MRSRWLRCSVGVFAVNNQTKGSMAKTAMLLTPSLEEVKLLAAKIGLPEREAEKFYWFYESKGWKVGRTKMVSFLGALQGWRCRWMDRNPGNGGNPANYSFDREGNL